MTDPNDNLLAALLGTPARATDEAFVSQIQALVKYERRQAALRRAAFRRVAIETGAAAAMLLAFVFAAKVGDASDVIPLFSPAMAGLVALGLWVTIFLREPARWRESCK
jgi:hypothetical protein